MRPLPIAVVMTFLLAAALSSSAGTLLQANGYAWDPLLGFPPNIPPEMRTESYAPGERGIWVVQFADPVPPCCLHLPVAAAGFVLTGNGAGKDAYLWVGTPEQAAKVRALSFVRYIDYWYPFEKGADTSRYDPRVRLEAVINVANTAGLQAALDDIATYGDIIYAGGGYATVVVRQSDWLRLLHNRYLIYAEVHGPSPPEVAAFLPRSALPGAHVVMSGAFYGKTPAVTIAGAPSPNVTMLDDVRADIEVPQGVRLGPADVLVRMPNGENQIVLASSAGAFSVGPPGSRTLEKGDMVEASFIPFCCFEGGYQRLQWSDGTGLARMLSALEARALAFDSKGRLLVTTGRESVWFDAAMQPAGPGPAGARNAKAIVFDRHDNLIVIDFAETRRYAPSGALLGAIGVGGVDGDLDSNQCTLFLAGLGGIRLVDLCTMTDLGTLPGTKANTLRVLPDGTLLTTDEYLVRRYRRDGSLVAELSTSPPAYFGAIGLSADGRFAWMGATQQYQIDGNTLTGVANSPRQAWQMAVYGGWTVARGMASYADAQPAATPTDVPGLSPVPLIALALALAGVALRR